MKYHKCGYYFSSLMSCGSGSHSRKERVQITQLRYLELFCFNCLVPKPGFEKRKKYNAQQLQQKLLFPIALFLHKKLSVCVMCLLQYTTYPSFKSNDHSLAFTRLYMWIFKYSITRIFSFSPWIGQSWQHRWHYFYSKGYLILMNENDKGRK